MHAAIINAKRAKAILYMHLKRIPSENINLTSPPPMAFGISARSRSSPPPSRAPISAFRNVILVIKEKSIPMIIVTITNLSGIILNRKSIKDTKISIKSSTSPSMSLALIPSLRYEIIKRIPQRRITE